MITDGCFCGSKKGKHVFFAQGYDIVRCLSCGQVRTKTPKHLKRIQYYQKENFSIYIEKEEMFRRLFAEKMTYIQKFYSHGRFVDIGAGVGLFVDQAKKAGFDAIGFEPSRGAVAAAKRHFGVELIAGEFRSEKITTTADIIVLNHVLEHLPDPPRIIRDARKALQKGGLLVIGVPNFGSYLSYIKRERWQSLIPDQHRWHFTLSTLDRLICPIGFVRVGVSWENHDRAMHYCWKKPIYAVLDFIALHTDLAEAMFVVYIRLL